MDQTFDCGSDPRVVHESPAYLVAYKPTRLHSEALPGGGASLAAWLWERYPETSSALGALGEAKSVAGRAETGLVHRLDFETSGLLLCARSSESFRFFATEQAEGRIRKRYRLRAAPFGSDPASAGLQGSKPLRLVPHFPEAGMAEAWEAAIQAAYGAAEPSGSGQPFSPPFGSGASDPGGPSAALEILAALLSKRGLSSRFRPFGPGAARVACLGADQSPEASTRARRGSPSSVYETWIEGAAAKGDFLEAEVAIVRGFRHQIRAHFAWLGLPLLGDPLYGAPGERLFLEAFSLRFRDPESGSFHEISLPPSQGRG